MPAKFPELFTDGITLKRETVTKFLDVFIDENVTWKARINSISTDLIPRKQSNQLYFPFVHSYLNYANLAWGSTQKTKSVLFIVNTLAPWCSGYHHCTTSFNNVWTQILRRCKPCSRRVGDLRWWESLTMVPAGNKA